MSNTVTPAWTDTGTVSGTSQNVVAATTLTNNGTTATMLASGTLDLRTKFGAWLYCALGRLGATAPGAAIQVHIRRTPDNGVAGAAWIQDVYTFVGNTTAGNTTTVNVNSNSGQNTLNIASATGHANGGLICVYDASGTAFARLEFCRVAKAGTADIVDTNLQFTHTLAQADNVTTQADMFSLWLPGGSLYTVLFDYSATATGSNHVVLAMAQTYDSESIV
jgi:hypothetical protein